MSSSTKRTKGLTPKDKEDIKAAFHAIDEDQDGSIRFDDLHNLLHVLGQNPTEAEIATITKRHSTGTNEHLSLKAVYKVFEDIGLKTEDEIKQEMTDAFRFIDKKGDGFITKVQLRHFLTKHRQDIVREDDFDAIMLAVDTNRDGKIDYKEFVTYLTS